MDEGHGTTGENANCRPVLDPMIDGLGEPTRAADGFANSRRLILVTACAIAALFAIGSSINSAARKSSVRRAQPELKASHDATTGPPSGVIQPAQPVRRDQPKIPEAAPAKDAKSQGKFAVIHYQQ